MLVARLLCVCVFVSLYVCILEKERKKESGLVDECVCALVRVSVTVRGGCVREGCVVGE